MYGVVITSGTWRPQKIPTQSPHGVMDITSAYEAGGSGFDPQWGLLLLILFHAH
jgi:hypothetical protein